MSHFWLIYRDHAGLSGVLILDSWSLAAARICASLDGADKGAQFCEGHELDRDSSVVVPLNAIGRMLSLEEAGKIIRRMEGVMPKRTAAASVKRRGLVRTKMIR